MRANRRHCPFSATSSLAAGVSYTHALNQPHLVRPSLAGVLLLLCVAYDVCAPVSDEQRSDPASEQKRVEGLSEDDAANNSVPGAHVFGVGAACQGPYAEHQAQVSRSCLGSMLNVMWLMGLTMVPWSSVVLCDRGALDGKSFVDEKLWAEVMRESGHTETGLLHRCTRPAPCLSYGLCVVVVMRTLMFRSQMTW